MKGQTNTPVDSVTEPEKCPVSTPTTLNAPSVEALDGCEPDYDYWKSYNWELRTNRITKVVEALGPGGWTEIE